jgi:hypothetical protein
MPLFSKRHRRALVIEKTLKVSVPGCLRRRIWLILQEFDLLDVFHSSPRPLLPDQLRLEEPDDGLRQRVVVGMPRLPTEGSMPASASRSV